MRSHQGIYDSGLWWSALSLLLLGLIMVASASIPIAEKKKLAAFYFASHQAIYLLLGFSLSLITFRIPLRFWQPLGPLLAMLSFLALTVLIIPGVSRPVNGSVRWIFVGPVSIQISEFAKLGVIIYISGYLTRHLKSVQTELSGFIKPLILMSLFAVVLLLEPDFGATVVLGTTVLGMMFMAGVPIRRFLALLGLVIVAFVALSVSSPYRMSRITAFLNPWANQFDSGYQLVQSLIAFGRGGWFGLGLGNSLQKLLYLPEPHTDFLFAVLAEELGLFGASITIALFCLLVVRAFVIGRRAVEHQALFAGFMAYGIGLCIALQVMINIGVNVGVLPTKGLTLPLMSYGGSSILSVMIELALLFRIDYETKMLQPTERLPKHK